VSAVVELPLLLGVPAEGYGWLPNRRRRAPNGIVRTRLLASPVVGLSGTEAVRFFYDEDHVRRHGAVPELVRGSLFGHRAIHTTDGATHQVRRAMFLSLLTDPGGVDTLVDLATAAWDDAVASWPGRPAVVLFDEASRILTRAACAWTGVPLRPDEVAAAAGDMIAMVDGFATLGPRHWRARLARGRRERWLAALVQAVREDATREPDGSAVCAVARHREADGRLFDPQLAAVELLNIIRPTVAVSWLVAFAAHALHRWPENRRLLREGDPGYAEAFAHEVRRFYPFAPFVCGRAVRHLSWQGEPIRQGTLILLDLYGQNHDPDLWTDPYAFRPQRFLDRPPARDELVPQGGGDPLTGHRCPGELITVALLRALAIRLAQLDYQVPEQDLTISLRRIPTRPADGFRIRCGRFAAGER